MIRTISEPSKEVAVSASCDVLVCGGGIAGVSAAIAAARNGAKVILLEREFGLGGLATLGLITIYLPICDGNGYQAEYGLVEELLRLSIEDGAQRDSTKPFWEGNVSPEERAKGPRLTAQFNPHVFNLKMEKLLRSLGVTIVYGAHVCGAVREADGKVSAVIAEVGVDRRAYECRTVVDASGDCGLLKNAGVPFKENPNTNGLASWYYYMGNGKMNLRMFGLADVIPEKGQSSGSSEENDVDNVISVKRYHGLDGEEISEMVQDGHTAMMADMAERRQMYPDFEPAVISQIPLLRMSRKIDGEYEMDDTEIRVRMEDSIGTICDWRKRGPVYELPFRCLYSAKAPNVLVAGRNISVTYPMWDITRVIPVCAVTGEAAGTAAAMSDDMNTLDVSELQARLVKQGVRLHVEDLYK